MVRPEQSPIIRIPEEHRAIQLLLQSWLYKMRQDEQVPSRVSDYSKLRLQFCICILDELLAYAEVEKATIASEIETKFREEFDVQIFLQAFTEIQNLVDHGRSPGVKLPTIPET